MPMGIAMKGNASVPQKLNPFATVGVSPKIFFLLLNSLGVFQSQFKGDSWLALVIGINLVINIGKNTAGSFSSAETDAHVHYGFSIDLIGISSLNSQAFAVTEHSCDFSRDHLFIGQHG